MKQEIINHNRMRYHTLTLLVHILNTLHKPCAPASPRTPLCLSTNHIAWMDLSPYLEPVVEVHNHSGGILMETLHRGLQACCRGRINFNFSVNFKTFDEIADIRNSDVIDIVIPVQKKDVLSRRQEKFVTLVQSPGIAFYLVPDHDKPLMIALASLKPMVIIMFLFVSVFGVAYWFTENIPIILSDQTSATNSGVATKQNLAPHYDGPSFSGVSRESASANHKYSKVARKPLMFSRRCSHPFSNGGHHQFTDHTVPGVRPQPFGRGLFSGFWWAFVTMTTIGYGDDIPTTRASKVLSVVWVLCGTVFCALLTSRLTNVLQLALIGSSPPPLSGLEVAVLRGSEEYKYAIQKQALPLPFDNMTDIVRAIEDRVVSAALLDVYVAAEHTDNLKHLHLQHIIEHVFFIGVAFHNSGTRFATCIRDYVLSRQMEIMELILKRVDFQSLSEHLGPVPIVSVDYRKPSFIFLVIGLMVGLIVVLSVGYAIEQYSKFNCQENGDSLNKEGGQQQNISEEDEEEELSLSQWRSDYKRDLCEAAEGIRQDMERIREKAMAIEEKLRQDVHEYDHLDLHDG